MFRRTAFFCLVAAPLAAQAPVITQQGDPSVKADSIYRLAVKPTDHPDEDAVYLLDDGVVRYEADGRGTQTFRQIVEILKPDAVDRYREFRFSYAPKHERFRINWMRVLKPDGTVISAAPTQEQDSDVPAQMGDPVYSDRKVKRLSLTGVAPGTIVDYSYTREELKPFLPGDFLQTWGVTTGLRTMRSRLVVDVPSTLNVRLREDNLRFKRAEQVANGRRIYTWATGGMEKTKGEAFASDSDGVSMAVYVASPETWGDIAKWYASNAKDRYVIGPATQQKLDSALAGKRTRDDTIRAVHKWVAQDTRYVSIALGLGGYQPRSPDTVVVTGFGDCKDKATLFVAALQRYGITAFPVLLNSSGGVKRDLPSIDQFDHAIAAVKLANGYQFVDLTSEFTPYGQLPPDEQGEFAVVVHPDGTSEQVTMPRDPIDSNRTEARLVGHLNEDGTFDGVYTEEARGSQQYSLRDAFENPLDSTQKADGANSIARRYFEGADGDSLTGFQGKDLAATPHLRVLIKHGKGATIAGSTAIFNVPFGSAVALETAAKELEKKERVYPIDAERIFGYRESLVELRMALPKGWKAQLPKSVTATSEFGSYSTEYAQEGDTLRITRRSRGTRGIYAQDKVHALADWFRAVAKDDAKLIVITKAE